VFTTRFVAPSSDILIYARPIKQITSRAYSLLTSGKGAVGPLSEGTHLWGRMLPS